MDLKDRVQSFVGHLLDIDDWKEWYMDIETIILHPSYDEQGNMIQFHSFFLFKFWGVADSPILDYEWLDFACFEGNPSIYFLDK